MLLQSVFTELSIEQRLMLFWSRGRSYVRLTLMLDFDLCREWITSFLLTEDSSSVLSRPSIQPSIKIITSMSQSIYQQYLIKGLKSFTAIIWKLIASHTIARFAALALRMWSSFALFQLWAACFICQYDEWHHLSQCSL